MTDQGLLRFEYRAAREDGRMVRGALLAPNEETVRRQVQTDGLSLVDVRTARGAIWERPVRRQDLAIVFRNLAILTESGVPVERALAASEALVGGRLRASLSGVRGMIREGSTVAGSMAGLPRVFPRSVVGTIGAGERSSRLAHACLSVADQLEHDARLGAEVRSSLSYPLLILFVGVASILVMGTVVVPRFADVIDDLGGELPAAARALIGVSQFLAGNGLYLGVGAAVAVAFAVRALGTTETRGRVDRALLRMPVIGGLRLGFASARICRALGAMLGSGMSLLDSLDAVADAAGDFEVRRRLGLARTDVSRGRPLAESLAEHEALTPLALQLVGVGEASGRLADMTRRAGELSGERAQRSLRAAVSLLEPLLVVSLGLLVAVVAAVLLQAVYSVRPMS